MKTTTTVMSELSIEDVLGEQGGELPERNMMRVRKNRHFKNTIHPIIFHHGTNINHTNQTNFGGGTNVNVTNQNSFGGGTNINTTNQTNFGGGTNVNVTNQG